MNEYDYVLDSVRETVMFMSNMMSDVDMSRLRRSWNLIPYRLKSLFLKHVENSIQKDDVDELTMSDIIIGLDSFVMENSMNSMYDEPSSIYTFDSCLTDILKSSGVNKSSIKDILSIHLLSDNSIMRQKVIENLLRNRGMKPSLYKKSVDMALSMFVDNVMNELAPIIWEYETNEDVPGRRYS